MKRNQSLIIYLEKFQSLNSRDFLNTNEYVEYSIIMKEWHIYVDN